MDRAEKMDCRSNGEVIFTGATTEFQLRMGLTGLQYFQTGVASTACGPANLIFF